MQPNALLVRNRGRIEVFYRAVKMRINEKPHWFWNFITFIYAAERSPKFVSNPIIHRVRSCQTLNLILFFNVLFRLGADTRARARFWPARFTFCQSVHASRSNLLPWYKIYVYITTLLYLPLGLILALEGQIVRHLNYFKNKKDQWQQYTRSIWSRKMWVYFWKTSNEYFLLDQIALSLESFWRNALGFASATTVNGDKLILKKDSNSSFREC